MMDIDFILKQFLALQGNEADLVVKVLACVERNDYKPLLKLLDKIKGND